MQVFLSTLSQMGVLFIFILIGYLLIKLKVVPDNAGAVLSKMENNVFTPASILGTFTVYFTVEKLSSAWQLVAGGIVVTAICIPLAIVISRITTKDSYVRKIYTYGLAFSNFGFMGNAVVENVYGNDVYMAYLIFVIPFWIAIYSWGVPALLMPSDSEHSTSARLKNMLNPMLICVAVGMVLGLLPFDMPTFVVKSINMLGACMSPVAMLLTGMAIAKIDLKQGFSNLSVYLISVIRLFAIPLATIAVVYFLPISFEVKLCAVCASAMPLGLSTIVVPEGYGLDTRTASSMALISHLMSAISIPIIFMIFDILFV